VQFRNETTLGDYFVNGSPGAQRLSKRDFVSPAPLIRGNKKSPNPWSYTTSLESSISGTQLFQLDSGQILAAYNGVFGQFPGYPNWFLADIEERCLDKLNEKIRNGPDLAVDIAEARQTIKMFDRIHKFERWFKGFGPKRWANEWLQYQYGWKPLLKDIYDAALQSTEVQLNRIRRFTTAVSEPLPRITINGVNGTFYPKGVELGSGRRGCRMSLSMRVDTAIYQYSQFSSLNPVSLGWELLPYSFVIDWFLNVGGYLRNLETALLFGSLFQSGIKTHWYGFDVGGSLSLSSYDGSGTYWTFAGLAGTTRRRQLSRTLLSGYPTPRLPRFEAKLGATRLLNAAALLTQLLK